MRESWEKDGVSLQSEYITDSKNGLEMVFDADLEPEKVSEGLEVFISGEEAEWIRNQTNQSYTTSEEGR